MPLANRVLRLVNRFGTLSPVKIVRQAEATYNRTDGSVSNPDPDTFETKAVKHGFEIQQVDGVTVQRGDQLFLIPALLDSTEPIPFTPRAGDLLLDDAGAKWMVMSLRPLPFKSDLIALDIHVRAS
jgi:hypothetical protein